MKTITYETHGVCSRKIDVEIDGDVIVNVFDRESREFYNLDRFFPAEGQLDISELIEEVDKKFEINEN